MAVYYFDTNGITSGFGTLTGTWDTAQTNWSLSSTGTSTTAAVTFTNADTASFGSSAVASTTAGTATVASGVTITLNRIETNNLTATQTIAAGTATTSTITLAGSTPTLNIVSGGVSIGARLSGSAGFTKTGSSYVVATNTNNNISGTVTISAGYVVLNPANTLPSITSFSIVSASYVWYQYTAATTLTGVAYSGAGEVYVRNNTPSFGDPAGGISFPTGAMTSLTGNLPPTGSAPNAYTVNGFTLSAIDTPSSTTGNIVRATIRELPRRLNFEIVPTYSAPTCQAYTTFAGSGGTYTTDIDLLLNSAYSSATLGTQVMALVNNATTSGLTITGGITRYGLGINNMRFQLRGSSAYSGTIQGLISDNGLGTLGIDKNDSGTWVLSGMNPYTGETRILAGTLVAASNSAFGASVSLSAGATLGLQGGISLNKSPVALTVGGGTIRCLQDANSITFSTITMNGSFSIVTDGASTFSTSSSITGGSSTYTLTLTGAVTLSNVGSSYTSATSITGGTTSVGFLANAAVASSLGAPALAQSTIAMSGNTGLNYVGTTAGSTSRAITCSGATGTSLTLSANGTSSGTVTYSGTLTFSGAGTHDLVLSGNSGLTGNVLQSVIADGGSGATSLTKSGSSRWNLQGSNNYTGSTTLSGGELYVTTASGLGASGSSNAITMSTATILAVNGSGITVNKASAPLNISGGTVLCTGGSNTFTFASIAMSGSFTIAATSSNRLTITSAISGSPASGTLTLGSGANTGTVLLSNTTNSYSAFTSVAGGTLEVAKLDNTGSNSSIGSSGSITLGTNGTATLSHVGTTADSTDRAISWGGLNNITFDSSGTGSGAVTYSSGGTFTIAFSAASRSVIFSGSSSNANTFARVIPNIPSATTSVTKSGAGRWDLTAANTYTGNTTLSGGTLTIGNQNAIQNSTLVHQTAGTTLSFDPGLTAATFGGLSGTATVGVDLAIPSGLTLSVGNINTTTYANGLSGSGNYRKTGIGSTTLSGTITATGQFTVDSGALVFGSTNRTLAGGLFINGGSVSITTGNTIAANTSFTTGGTITAVLTGNNTLTITSGATVGAPASVRPDAPSTGSNSFTGGAAIDGVVDITTPTAVEIGTAGNGAVLGISNTTTVSSTGVVRTKTTTTSAQRGRARYNNLTLQTGARMRIGSAA